MHKKIKDEKIDINNYNNQSYILYEILKSKKNETSVIYFGISSDFFDKKLTL
jgi:hypothetical protein